MKQAANPAFHRALRSSKDLKHAANHAFYEVSNFPGSANHVFCEVSNFPRSANHEFCELSGFPGSANHVFCEVSSFPGNANHAFYKVSCFPRRAITHFSRFRALRRAFWHASLRKNLIVAGLPKSTLSVSKKCSFGAFSGLAGGAPGRPFGGA